jgi:gas vesicle protein
MANKDSDFGSYLSGFIIGGLVGAVAALLLAPQTGEETRTIIKDKSIDLKDKTYATIEETYQKAESAALDARKKADELAEVARAKAVELKSKGQLVIDEQKIRLDSVVEAVKKPKTKTTKKKKADSNSTTSAPTDSTAK